VNTVGDKLNDEKETRDRVGGIGRTKLWQLDKKGELRGVSIGRRRFWPDSEIDRFLDSLKKQTPTR
jgi:predicted DNA-binding transcriptional regulator AlpA